MLPTVVLTSFLGTRRGRLMLALMLVAATAAFVVLMAGPVWAAQTSTTGGSQAFANGGTNIGNALEAWAKALLFGVAALMGLGALVRRSVGEGVTILILVVILGAFLYDQADTETLIHNLWSAIGG